MQSLGIERVTTAPAATITRDPMVTPGQTTAFDHGRQRQIDRAFEDHTPMAQALFQKAQ